MPITALCPHQNRRAHLLTGILLAAVLMLGAFAGVAAGRGKVPRLARHDGKWVGALQASASQAPTLVSAGVDRVSVQLGWNRAEPAPGHFDQRYLARVRRRMAAFSAAGLGETLDLGLQYPPSWVFSLKGSTHFVDQYHQRWKGPAGQNPPNLVFDPAVRRAAQRYIDAMARSLGSTSFDAVRVGGLLSGELRYPTNSYSGTRDDLWMYDRVAQSKAPFPGWVPGKGSPAEARASLDYYFNCLSSYESWLLRVVSHAFTSGQLEVLFPGWGLRPGALRSAIGAGLKGTTPAEAGGMISAGEDWKAQVGVLDHYAKRGVVYTTWLDAPNDVPSSPSAKSPAIRLAYEDPARYLSGLARAARLPMAGENTGPGSTKVLRTVLARARRLHLEGVMWMSASDLAPGGSVGPATFRAELHRLLRRGSRPARHLFPGSSPASALT